MITSWADHPGTIDTSVRVTALHVGYMDTDMTRRLDVPKADPAVIAKLAIDGIEAGDAEIIADDTSRHVLTGLSGGVPALYPSSPDQPERRPVPGSRPVTQ
jgi:NAD(P)-dependent dehydrogenase (short-subunit alcohol dehydrogenase family)